MSTVVVVSGLPGTGKTTLAKRLSVDLRIPAFVKDEFKEAILDHMAGYDLATSRLSGRVAFDLLFHAAEAHLSVGTD